MKQVAILISVCTGMICTASAQDRIDSQSLAVEFVLRNLSDGRDQRDAEAARRQRDKYAEQQFVERMNHFVKLWSELVHEYNERRVFNLRTARALSKAFHQLERNPGWLNADRITDEGTAQR